MSDEDDERQKLTEMIRRMTMEETNTAVVHLCPYWQNAPHGCGLSNASGCAFCKPVPLSLLVNAEPEEHRASRAKIGSRPAQHGVPSTSLIGSVSRPAASGSVGL